MDISHIFNIARNHKSPYRWESTIYYFKNYDLWVVNWKLWFVMEALQVIHSCWIQVVKANKVYKLDKQQIKQLFSNMDSYRTNKKIVWSNLLNITQALVNEINIDELSENNVEWFYRWTCPLEKMLVWEVFEFQSSSWKIYSVNKIWNVHTFTMEWLKDTTDILSTEYDLDILWKYKEIEWMWNSRRLLSNLLELKFWEKINNEEKIKLIKEQNESIYKNLKSKKEKNEKEKDNSIS